MKVRSYMTVSFIFAIAASVLSCSSSTDKPQSATQKSTFAHEQVSDKIHEIVSDKKRADKAVSIAETMFEETEDFLDNIIESRKQAIELSENYDTKREAFETHYQVFYQQRKTHSEKFTALSLQLRKVVTAGEWQKINAVLANEMQLIETKQLEKES